mgnify:CR=1 FL=1
MDNKKRSVHNSGPLGMLMSSGQIQEVNDEINSNLTTPSCKTDILKNKYILKGVDIEFSNNELMYINPNECEPWEYANRHSSEMGDIEGLMESIKINDQLQPGLIRDHSNPHGEIKYEVIFGRRRHQACLKLDKPFLVIKKNNLDLAQALAFQNSENKFRNDVSPYSDSIVYKKMLENGVFKNQVELAENLQLTKQSISDILSFTRIPQELMSLIESPYKLSVRMAVTISKLIDSDKSNLSKLLKNAHKIGNSITSSLALEKLCSPNLNVSFKAESIKSDDGEKLFSVAYRKNGSASVVFEPKISQFIDRDDICNLLKNYIKQKKTS